MLKEKITKHGAIAILMALSGAVLLLDFSNFSVNGSTFWGDIMILVNALFFGIYIVLVTPLVRKYNPYVIVKWNFITAFVLLFPLGINDLWQTQWNNFTQGQWGSLTYIILLTTLLVYFLNYYLPKITSPETIALYVYFQPFMAAMIAVWAGKDELNTRKIVSGFIIISGIYISQYGKRKLSKKS